MAVSQEVVLSFKVVQVPICDNESGPRYSGQAEAKRLPTAIFRRGRGRSKVPITVCHVKTPLSMLSSTP